MSMPPVYRRKMKGYNTYLNYRSRWFMELKRSFQFHEPPVSMIK